MLPDIQLRDIDREFVDIIADAIRHIKKFEKSRKYPPSRIELIGEFATHLRREARCKFSRHGFPKFYDKRCWYNIARPENGYWHFIYKGSDGVRLMDQLHANKLCEIAAQKVTSEDNDVDEKLSDLKMDVIGLDVYVSTAKKLNSEAELILTNLCATAENLQF